MATEQDIFNFAVSQNPNLKDKPFRNVVDFAYSVNPNLKSKVTQQPIQAQPLAMGQGKATSIGPMSFGQQLKSGIEQTLGFDKGTELPQLKEDIKGLETPAEIAGTVAAYSLMPEVMLPLRASKWLKAGATAYRAGMLGTLMGGIEASKQLGQRVLGANETPKTSGEAASRIVKPVLSTTGIELGIPAVGGAVSKAMPFVKSAVKRTVSLTSGVSAKALDAAISGGENVLKYVGLSADDVARMGSDIQEVVKNSKTVINDSARKVLGDRHEALIKANDIVSQHLSGIKNKIVNYGQELQSLIPTIKEKAGAEYQALIKKVIGKNSKYKTLKLDFRTGLADSIKSVRDDFGYGNPTRNPDPIGQEAFTQYVNRIVGLDKANIEDAFYLQKDLGNAIYRYRGTETAAALKRLRDGVLDLMNTVPEIKKGNTAYRTGMTLLDDLGNMGDADNLSKQVIAAFNEGGNKMDTLMRFAGADPKANKLLKAIITHADDYSAIESKGKVINKMAQGIEKIKDTYSMGDAENTMVRLSKTDPVVKKLLSSTKDKTEMYGRLNNLINSDKAYKQIIDTMGQGGNRKEALTKLSKEIPGLEEKISILQDAVLGQEFAPYFRGLPATGFGMGVLSGWLKPAFIAASPLFSPRFVGRAATAIGEASRALPTVPEGVIGKAIGGPASFMSYKSFNSPEEVKQAYRNGDISREQAEQELKNNHGMK